MATQPPYSGINGIFTTDDKHQDITKTEYDGQARPGQIVIDTADYQVYVSNADGQLNAVGASGNGTVGGSNTQIQFNDGGNFGGNAALRFDKATGTTYINDASVGDLQIAGSITGDLLPVSNITQDLGSPTQRWRDLWLSGTTIQLGPQTISANSSTVIFNGVVDAPAYAGDGSALFNIDAANIVGNIPQATSADTANVANIANVANSVAGANVTGTVANANVALRAGTVTANAQPNITSLGTLASLSTAGNIDTTGEITVENDNGHGGLGYAGMFTLRNANMSATNPTKFVRINSTGDLQIVNSAYTATIFSLTDSGKMTVKGADLGSIANLNIAGGTSGQVISTDGSGNLQWSDVAGGGNTGNITFDGSTIGTSDAGALIDIVDPAGGGINMISQSYTQMQWAADVANTGPSDTTVENNMLWLDQNGLTFVAYAADGSGQTGRVEYTTQGGVVATGNITATRIAATSNGDGTNILVGDDAYIGDVNEADTIQISGQQDSANGYIIFGDADTTKLGRSGTGPLTYDGDFAVAGNITASGTASPAPYISGFSSVSAENLTISKLTDLGAAANVTITGGASGQVLSTDGTGNLSWVNQGTGGGLPLANGTSEFNIPAADGNVGITAGTVSWTLGTDSVLTLPTGGTISEPAIPAPFPGYAIALKPSNTIDADQQLMVYPTVAGDNNHLHLTTGNLYNTELFLGNDDLYVKLANTGNVVINSNDNNGSTAQWTFDATGNLTLPTNSWTVNYANGTPVPLSNDAPLPPYKGFKATYGRMYESEPTISKLVIYKDVVTPTSSIDFTTENDDFTVSGLSGSDIVLIINLYGSSTTTPTPLSTLLTFVETVVDTVILSGGVEGNFNDIATMQSLFYSEIGTLTAAAGPLYSNFQFFISRWTVTSQGTLVEGSGAVFEITNVGDGTYQASGVLNPGSNYNAGQKILVLGTDLGGVSPDNDCIITLGTTDPGGGVFLWSVSGTAAGTSTTLYSPVTGTNYQVGNGLVINEIYRQTNGVIDAYWSSSGTNYVIGDVINLPGTAYGGLSPDNDLVITVSNVGGSGEVYALTVTGTTPSDQWPTNNISDGGDDQYDDGNYIDTDIESQIAYNGGVIVSDSTAFGGTGASYAVVYADSIFGVLVTGAQINTLGTSGGSGFDGSGRADTGDLFAGSGISIGDFEFNGGTMTATSDDIYIKASDDLYLDALGDDIFLRADDDIRIRSGANFTDDTYAYQWRFNSGGDMAFNNGSDGDYGYIWMNQLDSQARLQIEGRTVVGIKTGDNGREWNFRDTGSLTLPDGTVIGQPEGGGTTGIAAPVDAEFLIQTSTSAASMTWSFDAEGKTSLPTIGTGESTLEKAEFKGQRKVIPPFHWSAALTGTTPAVCYATSSDAIKGFKATFMVQHSNGGFEMFDVVATLTGADTFYTVSNRVKPLTLTDTTVTVDSVAGILQVTLTLTSGSSDAWVTFDATEFGIAND